MLRLGWVILYVPDVPAAVTFYEAAFGVPQRFVAPDGDYAEMATGETKLAFAAEALAEANGVAFRRQRPEDEPFAAEIAFVAEDVPAAYARAVAAGATPLVAPKRKPWGQTVAYVRDLNGAIVEIGEPVG